MCNTLPWGFWGRWSRIRSQKYFENSPIQYGGCNKTPPILAEKSTKNETLSNNFFYAYEVTRRFSSSLITKQKSEFENSLIQILTSDSWSAISKTPEWLVRLEKSLSEIILFFVDFLANIGAAIFDLPYWICKFSNYDLTRSEIVLRPS